MTSIPANLSDLVNGLLAAAQTTTGDGPTPVWSALAEHFGCDPSALPILSERFDGRDHANVQVGLDRYVAGAGRAAQFIGATIPTPAGGSLVAPDPPDLAGLMVSSAVRLGAVDRLDVPAGPDSTLSCIRSGLVLVSSAEGAIAIWLRLDSPVRGGKVALDVKAPTVAMAASFLDELGRHMNEHNVFRGQVVTFTAEGQGAIGPKFEHRPEVRREDLVLPSKVLDAIDGHTVGIAEAADDLRAAGRHLKRGLLLYGAPGTGKTLTVRYVLSRLPGATVFYLAGSSMGWLTFATRLAERLAPAVIVLDDVDLIAEDRNLGGISPRRHLFDLLDAMDGINEDADLLFICTTNRPEALEKAVSARPGRVDLAVEIGLPDADCRRRLIELYAEGLDLIAGDLDAVVARTEGATAGFMKELLRRAALEALRIAPDSDPIAVDDRALARALDTLLDPLTSLRPLTGAPNPGGAS